MPRQSPYAIVLTPEEREALESIARRYTSPYCDVIRARIILLAVQNLPNDVIAFRLDIPRQIVTKWRKRFHRELSSVNRPYAEFRIVKGGYVGVAGDALR